MEGTEGVGKSRGRVINHINTVFSCMKFSNKSMSLYFKRPFMGGMGQLHHNQSPWLEMNYIYLQRVNTCLLNSGPTILVHREGDKVWKEIGPAQNHTAKHISRHLYFPFFFMVARYLYFPQDKSQTGWNKNPCPMLLWDVENKNTSSYCSLV